MQHVLPFRTNFFKNSFFPSVILEWNKLDLNLRNSSSLESFKASILKYIRPCPNSIFGINNPLGIKLLTRLRVGFSHLREHKFKFNFQDTLNPFCSCGEDIETTTHFFLHCQKFTTVRQALLDTIRNMDVNILNQSDFSLTQFLLFGDLNLTQDQNVLILNASIKYILESGRFDESLF